MTYTIKKMTEKRLKTRKEAFNIMLSSKVFYKEATKEKLGFKWFHNQLKVSNELKIKNKIHLNIEY